MQPATHTLKVCLQSVLVYIKHNKFGATERGRARGAVPKKSLLGD